MDPPIGACVLPAPHAVHLQRQISTTVRRQLALSCSTNLPASDHSLLQHMQPNLSYAKVVESRPRKTPKLLNLQLSIINQEGKTWIRHNVHKGAPCAVQLSTGKMHLILSMAPSCSPNMMARSSCTSSTSHLGLGPHNSQLLASFQLGHDLACPAPVLHRCT